MILRFCCSCWKQPARAHCFYKHRKVCWTAVPRCVPVGTTLVRSVCSQSPVSVMEVRASQLPLEPMGPAAWVAPVCMDLWGLRWGAEDCHLNPCFLPFRIQSMFPSLADLLGFVYHINKLIKIVFMAFYLRYTSHHWLTKHVLCFLHLHSYLHIHMFFFFFFPLRIVWKSVLKHSVMHLLSILPLLYFKCKLQLKDGWESFLCFCYKVVCMRLVMFQVLTHYKCSV